MEQTEAFFLSQVRAHQGIILKLVGLYANNQEEHKDLYQEILYQAWKGFGSFRGDAKFSTWLYRISLNTILTAQRKVQRISYHEALPEPGTADDAESYRNEHTVLLRQAIRRLPETERAMITLHLDGYSNPEIASIMGISINNATVKLHRIKQQLITRLQPQLL